MNMKEMPAPIQITAATRPAMRAPKNTGELAHKATTALPRSIVFLARYEYRNATVNRTMTHGTAYPPSGAARITAASPVEADIVHAARAVRRPAGSGRFGLAR